MMLGRLGGQRTPYESENGLEPHRTQRRYLGLTWVAMHGLLVQCAAFPFAAKQDKHGAFFTTAQATTTAMRASRSILFHCNPALLQAALHRQSPHDVVSILAL